MVRLWSVCIVWTALLVCNNLVLAQEGGGGWRAGGGGGWRGAGGGWSMDPNEMFNRMSNGKDTITRAEITNPMMQGMFDRMMERMGNSTGQITRDQFVTYMNQRRAERGQGGGGFGGRSGPPAAPGSAPAGGAAAAQPNGQPPVNGGTPEAQWSTWAEAMFRRYDQNGDGYLNNDEMPEELRAERDKWDTDHNGLIDLNEFKAYFQARMQQRMSENGLGNWWANSSIQAILPAAPAEEEEKKPVVYKVGKLPKELPAWFQQLDTDKDAQIGLYEWKAAGRSIMEFQEIDRNQDGFLTVDEVLAYEAKKKNGGNEVASAGRAGTAPVMAAGPGGSDSFRNRRRGDR
jgi:Ca2+-binding EF-hand superfamily protein